MQRTLKDYLIITLKGLAMGAADVVPGVSGGTIAFISGIYDELISSIDSIGFKTLKILKNDGIKAMYNSVNGNFLLSLFIGIGISVVSLASLFKYLLENEPILLWSFFFGLVIASVLYIVKQITEWRFLTVLLLLFGVGLAYYITIIPPVSANNDSSLFLVLAGALAICAMILPDGAFILLLLGAYKPALDAIHDFDIKKIALLGLGAIVGLLSFAKILKWLFDKYKNLTLAVLTGFVIGSLNKIWPYKETISTRIDSHGNTVPLFQTSISPFADNGDFGNENHLLYAIGFAVIGFAVILILEKLGSKKHINS